MVDEEVFVTKLEHVDEFVSDLREMRGMSRQAYVDDLVVQRAVERTLMNLAQATIDLASHVRRSEGLGPAETSKEEIDCLREAGLVSAETSEKLQEAVGFRNVLAHRTARSITTSSTTCSTRTSSGSSGSSENSRRGTAIDGTVDRLGSGSWQDHPRTRQGVRGQRCRTIGNRSNRAFSSRALPRPR